MAKLAAALGKTEDADKYGQQAGPHQGDLRRKSVHQG